MKVLKTNLDRGSKYFTSPSLVNKTIKELRDFALSRDIKIPSEYTNKTEILTYIDLQLKLTTVDNSVYVSKRGR